MRCDNIFLLEQLSFVYPESVLTNPVAASAYYRELERLPATIAFARGIPISPLSDLLGSLANRPLLAVGSGGSFTAATFAAILHESAAHQIGKATTPYQSVAIKSLVDAGVVLISAGGNNLDAITAFRSLAKRAAGNLVVVTASPNSRLARLADKGGIPIFSFELPFSRDGFLATNTLMATSLLLSRAYQQLSWFEPDDSSSFGEISRPQLEPEDSRLIQEVLSKDTLFVLAGGWTWPAAVDLESKFSEAGLTHVQLVDYRNFAHGRHFWLAKRAESTGILALVCPDTAEIAKRTLSMLPGHIKSFALVTDFPRATGAVDLLFQEMFVVGLAGEQFGTTLARPGIPEFGRRLYRSGFEEHEPPPLVEVWAVRKMMAIGFGARAMLDEVHRSLTKFLTDLSSARFEALVTDYDGTICDSRRIGALPNKQVQKELIRLLDGGLILGVATGRGNSVARALRQFIPEPLWNQVIVGCYGGASVSCLSDESVEPLVRDQTLVDAERYLKSNLGVLGLHLDLSPQLLSVRHSRSADLAALRNLIVENLDGQVDGCRVVKSAHSVDILGEMASKLRVVESVIDRIPSKDPASVIRMGDQGDWGGNDYDLLASGFSLSVDRVSGNLSACWNISQPGRQWSLAAGDYLRALKQQGRAFRFEVAEGSFQRVSRLT